MSKQALDLLIANGTLLTMDKTKRKIKNGAIAIRDGKIVSIGTMDQYANSRPSETLDAQGGIVLPGLVNAHTHLPMSIFRGLADDLPLDIWLNEHMFPAEAEYVNPKSVQSGTMLSCAEMLLSGTTTCCDGYFHEDAVAKTVKEIAMRSILAQGIIDFPAPGVPNPAENIKAAKAFLSNWQDITPLILPSAFCHSPYTCSEKTLTAAKETARSKNALFQIHVAETRDEREKCLADNGVTPVQYLDRLGLLDSQTLLVHAIWVDDKDIEIISARGATVSITTESEMKLASGIAPVPRYLEAKIPVGLGTDGCASNNNLDLFQEMDFTAKLHKVNQLDPTLLDARSVLEMATIGGARALGLADKIGSLEAGKQADVIIIDMEKPHLVPLYDEISHIVYAINGSDVRDVLVDGKILVRNRELLTIDLKDTLKQVTDINTNIKQGRSVCAYKRKKG